MRQRTPTQLHAILYMGSNGGISRGRIGFVAKKKGGSFKVGRDAKTGRFIPVKHAQRRKSTAVVETIRKKK